MSHVAMPPPPPPAASSSSPSSLGNSVTFAPQPPRSSSVRRQCPSSRCGSFNSEATSEGIFCADCGTVIEESSFDLSVSFTDNQDGSRSMNGQFVSNMSTTPYRFSSGGGVGYSRESREVTIANGKKRIQHLAAALKLNHFVDAAHRLFLSAVQRNFVHGRKTTTVVAACLYIVCRQRQAPHLLIDFSDVLQTNVYVLGNCFLKFRRLLNLQLPAIDPAHYIDRFAAKLEFEDKTHEVAKTAHKLVARMKRDWIQTGRRPSGVCGAALIIAARMHGFHRTQREVVNVMKICEETLRKRLVEFEATPSGNLTVEEFLQVELPEEANPPSFTRNRDREARAKELEDRRRRLGLGNLRGSYRDHGVPLALLAEASTSQDDTPNPPEDVTISPSSASGKRKRTRAEIQEERARAQEQLYSSLERELEQSLRSFEEEEAARAAEEAQKASGLVTTQAELGAPGTTLEAGSNAATSVRTVNNIGEGDSSQGELAGESQATQAFASSQTQEINAEENTNASAKDKDSEDSAEDNQTQSIRDKSTPKEPSVFANSSHDAAPLPPAVIADNEDDPASAEAEDDLLFQDDVDCLVLKPDESRVKKVLWQVQNRAYLEKERQDRKEGKVKRKRKRRPRQDQDGEGGFGESSQRTIPEANKRMSRKINYEHWQKLFQS